MLSTVRRVRLPPGLQILMETQQIQAAYNQQARFYEFTSTILGWLGLNRLRRMAFSSASGTILEVAVGNGKNLYLYPKESQITAVDISQAMLGNSMKRANRLSRTVTFKQADAESLPFMKSSFDTVVSSLSVCIFADPVQALKEMRRVCRPEGRILLLEHGRSNLNWVSRYQDKKAAKRGPDDTGCYPNRDPEQLSRKAGLKIDKVERPLWGYFYIISARP